LCHSVPRGVTTLQSVLFSFTAGKIVAVYSANSKYLNSKKTLQCTGHVNCGKMTTFSVLKLAVNISTSTLQELTRNSTGSNRTSVSIQNCYLKLSWNSEIIDKKILFVVWVKYWFFLHGCSWKSLVFVAWHVNMQRIYKTVWFFFPSVGIYQL